MWGLHGFTVPASKAASSHSKRHALWLIGDFKLAVGLDVSVCACLTFCVGPMTAGIDSGSPVSLS